MFLENLDFISPKITFYYKGQHRHNTVLGGFLTVFMIFIILSFSIYYFIGIITHRNQTSSVYDTFEDDVNYYPFNSSSIFHFLWVHKYKKETSQAKIDFNSIRIIMLNQFEEYESNEELLENLEHWVYDKCNEKDLLALNNNLNFNKYYKYNDLKYVNNAACIRYYYNKTEKKYYSANDTNKFKWPYLQHGIDNNDNILLGTIIEKCNNNSITNQLFGYCKTENEIINYIKEYNCLHIEVLNNYIDCSNFLEPIQSYYNSIDALLDNKNDYSVINIYFHPLTFRDNRGILFGGFNETNLFFVEDEKVTIINNDQSNNILLEYLFWMKNYKEVYQRQYDNILSVLQNIGGLIQITYYIFFFVNYFFNRYALDTNTQILFLGKDLDPDSKDTGPKNIGIHDSKNFYKIRKNFFSDNEIMKKFESYMKNSGNDELIKESDNNKNVNIKRNLTSNAHSYKYYKTDNSSDISSFALINNKNIDINFKNINSTSHKKLETIIEKNEDQKGLHNSVNIPRDNIIKNDNNSILEFKTKNSINKSKKILSITKYPNAQSEKKISSTLGNNLKGNLRKTKTMKVSGHISLLDAFNNQNHPMFAFFNLDINKKGIAFKKFFEEKITLKKYLFFILTCKKSNCNIKLLERFHMKLLSEEYLYHSHILLFIIHQKMESFYKFLNNQKLNTNNEKSSRRSNFADIEI